MTEVRVADIARVVAEEFGVARHDLFGPWRNVKAVRARQAVSWLARRHTFRSFPQIGRVLKKDHSTVVHAAKRMEQLRLGDPDLANKLSRASVKVRALKQRLKTRKREITS